MIFLGGHPIPAAVLLARLSGFTTQSEFLDLGDAAFPVDPDVYAGWYQPTVVVDYKVATIYTTLFDAGAASKFVIDPHGQLPKAA